MDLRKYWQKLQPRFSRRPVRSTDTGLFDPFVPIPTLKKVADDFSADYNEAEEQLFSDQALSARSFVALRLFILLLGALLAFRLISLQIAEGQSNYSLAEGNRLRTRLLSAPRGLFYDRNGVPLVQNIPTFAIVFHSSDWPKKAADQNQLIAKVAPVLQIPPDTLSSLIKNNLKKDVVSIREGITRDDALAYQLKLDGVTGVELITSPIRQYSGLPSLGHLIGYTGKINDDEKKAHPELQTDTLIGKAGLEKFYDDQLQGQPGIETTEVDSIGRTIRAVGETPPQVGQSLLLNLDSSLQQTTANALQDSIQKNKAVSGAAVMMDVRTGSVLAMVSFPSFDNNIFSPQADQGARQALLTDALSPLLNRAVAGQYPSGSTIKPVIAAAALQEKVVTPSTKFDTSQPITVGQQTYHDWKVHGVTDVEGAIAQSNDIFFYSIGGGQGNIKGLGIDRLDNYLSKFGFGKKTGIDLPGEQAGNVPTPAWQQKVLHQSWHLGDTYNLSIGQGGFLVTPLQLTDAIAAVANGGTLYQPRLLKSTIPSGGTPKDSAPVVTASGMVSSDTINAVRQGMLQATLPGGTAHSILGSLPIQMGAKTGTAQIGSSLTNTHAWFTAFAPFNNPEIALSVVVEGGGEGFDVAGPVVRQMIEQYFHLPLSPIVPAPPDSTH